MKKIHAKKSLSKLWQMHSSKDRTLSLITGYCSTMKKGQAVTLHPHGHEMLKEGESVKGPEWSEPLLTITRSGTCILFFHLQNLNNFGKTQNTNSQEVVSRPERAWRKAEHKNHTLKAQPTGTRHHFKAEEGWLLHLTSCL